LFDYLLHQVDLFFEDFLLFTEFIEFLLYVVELYVLFHEVVDLAVPVLDVEVYLVFFRLLYAAEWTNVYFGQP